MAFEEAEKVTAYHEAGKMVAAWELGLTVTEATIVPNPEAGYLGRVLVPVEDRVRYADWVNENEYLYAHLVTHYAGIAAHEIYTGLPMSGAEVEAALESYGSDYFTVSNFILSIAGPDEEDQVEVGDNAWRHAKNLIRGQWKRVSEIADVLLERETLDEGECRQVLSKRLDGDDARPLTLSIRHTRAMAPPHRTGSSRRHLTYNVVPAGFGLLRSPTYRSSRGPTSGSQI